MKAGKHFGRVAGLQKWTIAPPPRPLDERVDIAVDPHRNSSFQHECARFVVHESPTAGGDDAMSFSDEARDHAPFSIAEIGLVELLEYFRHGHRGGFLDRFVRIDEMIRQLVDEKKKRRKRFLGIF